MKKIAILAFFDKYDGGVYQYTQSIIDALKDDKANQYIIFCNEDDMQFDNYDVKVRKIKKPTIMLVVKLIRTLQRFFFIRKPIFFSTNEINIFSDIDIFISPSISAYPHFYVNKPFVLTLHDMQERYHPEFFSTFERVMRWLNNRALARSATQIICESEYVKNDINKFIGIKKGKISVIQSPPPENFICHEFEKNKYKKVKNKYNLPDNYIYYPAQCWFHKNHIKLVEAFNIVRQQVDDIGLVLTGSQQNNYKNLMLRIEQLGLKNKVKHLGYIDYEDLPYLYKMSQFLVMPTLFESISIPIYEAFALRVPVCCSNVVALPEQVGDAALIFDPHNIDDMANKMLMYLQSERLCKKNAQNGFRKVTKFNHNEYRHRLLNVINFNCEI